MKKTVKSFVKKHKKGANIVGFVSTIVATVLVTAKVTHKEPFDEEKYLPRLN